MRWPGGTDWERGQPSAALLAKENPARFVGVVTYDDLLAALKEELAGGGR